MDDDLQRRSTVNLLITNPNGSRYPLAMTNIAETHRDWANWLVHKTGLAISRVATESGLAATTLSRNKKEDFRGYSQSIIQAVVDRFGVPTPEEWSQGFSEDDAAPYPSQDKDPIGQAILLELGENTDIWEVTTDSLALEGMRKGDHMAVTLGDKPMDGDVVVVNWIDYDAGTSKTLIRKYKHPFLMNRQVVADEHDVLLITDSAVRIRGIVRASWRMSVDNFYGSNPDQQSDNARVAHRN